jgi:transcriptional regulator with XRE-family HTH domain
MMRGDARCCRRQLWRIISQLSAMSEFVRRATTSVMAAGGQGVAYEFWVRVERARVARQMSKTELAELAGVSRPTIDRMETTTRAPVARNVHRIADALGIPREEAEQLAGLVPPDRSDPVAESATLRALETDPTLSPEHRALLRETAIALMRSYGAEGQAPELRVVPPVGDAEQAG